VYINRNSNVLKKIKKKTTKRSNDMLSKKKPPLRGGDGPKERSVRASGQRNEQSEKKGPAKKIRVVVQSPGTLLVRECFRINGITRFGKLSEWPGLQ